MPTTRNPNAWAVEKGRGTKGAQRGLGTGLAGGAVLFRQFEGINGGVIYGTIGSEIDLGKPTSSRESQSHQTCV